MSRRRVWRFLPLLALTALLTVLFNGSPPTLAANLPAGFSEATLTNVGSPTALAFTPDGRLLITTKNGQVRVYQNNALLPTPALAITASKICDGGERGLLGIAVDPEFATNRYVYLYYSANKFNSCSTNTANAPVNRVSRFQFKTASQSNIIDPASELILLDNMHSPNSNHNAGDLHFGQDGLLYVSVGDGGCKVDANGIGQPALCAGNNPIARNLKFIVGKMLRINKDGSIPTDNPYVGATNATRCADPVRVVTTQVPEAPGPCVETFAWGLRNPFRFAFKPGTNDFFINDVGQGKWEEINASQRNADYGWNIREGFCVNNLETGCRDIPNATVGGLTDPVHAYLHGGATANCNSITGGAFVPTGVWPTEYNSNYLFADYVCGKIFRLIPAGGGNYTRQEFITGGGAIIHLIFGPATVDNKATQALYYTTFNNGGEVRRITHNGSSNRSPTAAFTASPTISSSVPLIVNFDASLSSDLDGNPLSYVWNFGDASPVVTLTNPLTSHTYNAAGVYTATLRVRDSLNADSDTVSKLILVKNTPPVPTILSPTTDQRFRVGEVITLSGSATDAEDGPLPPSKLSWNVLQFHRDHTHSFFGIVTGTNITMPPAPAPEDLTTTTDSYLIVTLTATDSMGVSTTVSQTLQPRRVNLTFVPSLQGSRIEVAGTVVSETLRLVSWEGYMLQIDIPIQTDTSLTFTGWSQGGPALQNIVTPANDTTYTANFSVPGCAKPLEVTNPDGEATNCGALRYAIEKANGGAAIKFNPSLTVNLGQTLTVSKGLTFEGDCSAKPLIGRTGSLNGPILRFTVGGNRLHCVRVGS